MAPPERHRFYPIAMTWYDLAFIHWPFNPESVQKLIPPSLELDTFEGKAYIGVVPFGMKGVGYPLLRNLPGSKFLELNVRTYVKAEGCSGVWFFSLDAASAPAVWFCGRYFFLPYYFAKMKMVLGEDKVCHYYSSRAGEKSSRFEAHYQPAGPVYRSKAGELDHWLTERYCLFSQDPSGKIYRCDIRHDPWPLQPGRAEIAENSMLAPLGLAIPAEPPLVHFAKRLKVKASHLIRV
jgi:uncharacterized protein YqjF (DUF2071 family)